MYIVDTNVISFGQNANKIGWNSFGFLFGFPMLALLLLLVLFHAAYARSVVIKKNRIVTHKLSVEWLV